MYVCRMRHESYGVRRTRGMVICSRFVGGLNVQQKKRLLLASAAGVVDGVPFIPVVR